MSQSESNRPIASVLSTFRVLEEVAQRQPVGVSEIARGTGMPKSTVQRCLLTLHHAGWLRMVDPDRAKWGVTTKPLGIGLRAAGEEGLREAAAPYLDELRDLTDETVHLTARDGDQLIVLSRRDSTQAVRTHVDIGAVAPMHATSSGLAVLAHLPDEEVHRILDGGLERFTPETIVAKRDLLEEIRRTRERGFAVNTRSWWRPDVSAVAAAVLASSGRPIAAIAISIPSMRFDPERIGFYGTCATDIAQKISKALESF
ncbi:IclR family transcriptional regulator [Rhodococcus aetherivorans]|uniref:IclR family transcriptional regulator n=1 Tax=Rhodococcus aetherivorans TaxID=191292 RepID=UPI001C8C9CDC|nr:IclR family transcriptional regulator [Rhodococcus aetherivorans]